MGRGHGHDGAPVLKLLALPGALTTLRLCQALNPPMLAAPAAQAPSLRVAVNVLEGGAWSACLVSRPLAANPCSRRYIAEPRTYITERTCQIDEGR